MATSAPHKYAIGQPMIDWCTRHGLDANRVPVDRLTVTPRRWWMFGHQHDELLVEAWEMYDEGEPVPPRTPRETGREWGGADQLVYVRSTFTTTDPPPLDPEWVALFGNPFHLP